MGKRRLERSDTAEERLDEWVRLLLVIVEMMRRKAKLLPMMKTWKKGMQRRLLLGFGIERGHQPRRVLEEDLGG